MNNNYPTITVGDLKRQLEGYPADWTLDFSGLEFHRVKQRSPTHVQVEFTQLLYRMPEGRVVVETPD
jgi:hypothetical protein